MKKIIALLSALVFALPFTSFAAVNSIDGLTAPAQLLVSPGPNAANSMHMNIVNVGTDTHRFKWDGSAWAVNQGGSGGTSDPQASIDVSRPGSVGSLRLDGDTSYIVMKDSDGDGYTYITANDGMLSASTEPCN